MDRDIAWVGTDSAAFEHPANNDLRTTRPDLVPEMEEVVAGHERFGDSTWMIAHRWMLGAGRLHVDQVGGSIGSVPQERVTLAIFPWRFAGGEASIVA